MDLALVLASTIELFNRQQERIVHQALTVQECNVFSDGALQDCLAFLTERHEAFVGFGGHEEVDVLESRRGLRYTFDFAVDDAAFKVKDVLQVVAIFESKHVLHQHEMHWRRRVHIHGEDAKDFGKNAVGHSLVVLG